MEDLGLQYWLEQVRRYAAAHSLHIEKILHQFQSFERSAWPTAAQLQAARLPWAIQGPCSYRDDQFFFEVDGLVELDPRDVISDAHQMKKQIATSIGADAPQLLNQQHPVSVASASSAPQVAHAIVAPVAAIHANAAASSAAPHVPADASVITAPTFPADASSLHRIVEHQTPRGETIPLLYLDVLKDGSITSVPHLPMSKPYLKRYFDWSDAEAQKNIDKIRNKFKAPLYKPFCKRFVDVEGHEHLYKRYYLSIKKHNQPAFVPVFCLEEIMPGVQKEASI